MSIAITTAADAILALHKSDGGHNPLCHCGIEGGSGATCIQCRVAFPCPTRTAIEDDLLRLKRFSDAELAAEYLASHGEGCAVITGNPKLRFSKRRTLLRFATLPHYDED